MPGRHEPLYKLLAVDYGENLTVTTNSGRKDGEQKVSVAMKRYTRPSKKVPMPSARSKKIRIFFFSF